MTTKYKKYPEYEMSEYFRVELPTEWKEKRLGFIADQNKTAFVDGPFGSDLKTDDYLDSGVPLIQLNNIRDNTHNLKSLKYISVSKKEQLCRHIARPGDVVIAKMADPVARAAVVVDEYDEYVIVADCVKLTPNLSKISLSYLVWAINSEIVRTKAELVSTGTTRVRINLTELKKLKVPYPSYKEQQQIADFLDYETSKIDTLIEKQEKLIELLKEKRQAVISHAVTKGLNPNVPMKDSGVEWLGEIPEHWGLCTLRRCANFVDGDRGKEYPSDSDIKSEGILFLSSKNIIEGRLDLSEVKYISEQKFAALNRGKTKDGDLIVKVRGSAGRIGELAKFNTSEHGCDTAFINAQMMIIRPHKTLLSDYAVLISKSVYWYEQLLVGAYGTAQQQLSNDIFSNLYIVLPSITEQEAIIGFVEDKENLLNQSIAYALMQIKLLKERRTSLISATVTGKIDVRDWVRPE